MAKRGSELKAQWPETTNVLSILTTEQLSYYLKLNPEVSVSEKLDGSNFLLSSDGWVASRRIIIVEDLRNDDLSKLKFNKSNISSLRGLSEKLDSVHNEMVKCLERANFETFVYGEWLQHRTANTQQDRFKYKKREFKDKNFYAFGLAIYFREEITKQEMDKAESQLEMQFKWNSIKTQEPLKFIIINFDKNLQIFLQGKGFDCVPWLLKDSLANVLRNKDLSSKLLKRNVEGFVLTGKDLLLKWKFIERGDKSSQIEALTRLREASKGELIDAVIDSLETVCLHSEATDNSGEPRKRPDKQLYSRLFKSSETKFPKIENLCQKETPKEDILAHGEDFKRKFKKEIKEDIVKLGYQLIDEYEEEIDSFVDSIFEKRISNCIKKKDAVRKPANGS
jgi:hypothetical protein